MKYCSHIESFSQVRQPKLSNLAIVAINITAEYMSYNSELQLFRAIKGTELEGLFTTSGVESLLDTQKRFVSH